MEASKTVEDVNYGLGFNDVDFSDRVLRLEIEHSRKRRRTQNRRGKSAIDLEVESLNVCSLMLAAKSPFFSKLFKNCMKESKKTAEFTVKINASEKAAFMDLLNSIYDRPLAASSQDELMDVMVAADKFEVTSCARHCVRMLLEMPMTIEYAIFYLEFPCTVFASEVTRPLLDAAKKHLCSHFSGFTESQQDEAMSLPLCGIEAVVGAADFQLKSEEALLDFMLKWARKHYPDLIVRRHILTNRLLGLICLPCLSYSKLIEIVNIHDFDDAQVAKLVLKALSYKIELRHSPKSIPTVNEALLSNNALSNCAFPRRTYNHRRVVFFDINKQDCAALTDMSPRIYSEAFNLGERLFSLFAKRDKKMGGSEPCSLSFEFSAMMKPSYGFRRLLKSHDKKFTETSNNWGETDLFNMPWTKLLGEDDNDFIIDDVIHIRAQLTLND